MQNWLLVGNDKEVVERELLLLIASLNIVIPNIYRFNSTPEEFNIEVFREMLKLTQRHFDQPTAFVVENFETFSEIMQNTFLKTLEEHQGNLCFLLVTRKQTKVLPTVRSRCRIINLKSQTPVLNPADEELFNGIMKKLTADPQHLVSFEAGLGIKNKKEKALAFLEKFLLYAHATLPHSQNKITLARYARRALELRDLVENNNLDPEMAIDQVFLS